MVFILLCFCLFYRFCFCFFFYFGGILLLIWFLELDRWECYVFVKEGVYNVIVIDLLVEIYLGVSYVFILLIESWLLNFINCLCISICFDVVIVWIILIFIDWLIDCIKSLIGCYVKLFLMYWIIVCIFLEDLINVKY